jgi:prefoldin subunit 5
VPGGDRAGRWAAPLADPEAEKQALKSQAEYLQSEMDAIKKRLDELMAKGQN